MENADLPEQSKAAPQSRHELAVEAHARLMDAIARRYNEATPEERKRMDASLADAKARAVSSVRGIRSLFPGLGTLKVTKQGATE